MSDILLGLNEQQKKAVQIVDKPLLILAGAGAGKTKTIVHKIAYLIKEKNYKPFQILALTFTKKAATEMKDRVKNLLNESKINTQGLFLGTFHSFGALLLRKYGEYVGLNKNFTIYDTQDQLNLIKAIIKDGIIDSIIKPSIIHKQISSAKVTGITPENYFEHSYQDRLDELVTKAYFEYSKRLKALNAVDFTDLLLYSLELLEKHPNIAEQLSEKYKYIVVDEYQDTNKAQYKIIYNLSKNHRHLAVVGDEDQSIYSWRGATIENIQMFRRDFPEHEIVKLEQNYRSTQIILHAANKVIEKNPNRIGKNLWTNNNAEIPIKIVEVDNPKEEASFISKVIKRYYLNTEKTVAILYRVNSQSRLLEEQLVKLNIPYKIIGNVGFYERMEIKDILAYLKYLHNPKDEISLMRIINIPARRIGPKAIETIKKQAKENQLGFAEYVFFASVSLDKNLAKHFISKPMQQKLNKSVNLPQLKNYKNLFELFKKLIDYIYIQNQAVNDIIKFLIENIDYYTWISKISSTEEEIQARFDNIAELLRLATNTVYSSGKTNNLGKFLEDIALIESVKEHNSEQVGNVVNLMTVHSAKGLEFDVVFIVGAVDGIFPHNRSKDNPMQLQEERRLFYVAITRAKTDLFITYPRFLYIGNEFVDAEPSEYISDIPWENVQFINGPEGK